MTTIDARICEFFDLQEALLSEPYAITLTNGPLVVSIIPWDFDWRQWPPTGVGFVDNKARYYQTLNEVWDMVTTTIGVPDPCVSCGDDSPESGSLFCRRCE